MYSPKRRMRLFRHPAFAVVVGPIPLTSAGSNDTFVVKYSTAGTPQWARKIAGSRSDIGLDVSVDPFGNAYVIGTYTSSPLTIFDVDNTTAFTTLANESTTFTDTFIVKYNATGTPQWARRLGGTGGFGTQIGNGISTDVSGNVYVTGTYSNGITVFGTDNTTTFTSLTNVSGEDIFTVKYDTAGTPQWARKIGGAGTTEKGYEISTDQYGNVYVGGVYNSTSLTIFNADNTTAFTTISGPGGVNGFVVKYDTAGIPQWVRKVGSTDGVGNNYIYGTCTELSGNVYVIGNYESTPLTIFNSDNTTAFTTLANSGSSDVFVVKYDTAGIPQWARKIAESGTDIGGDISIDSFGNVYITGSSSSNPLTIFNTNNTTAFTTIANSGTNDAFVVKYSTAGTPQWARKIAGTLQDDGLSISAYSSGIVYISGKYTSTPLTIFNTNNTTAFTTLANSGSSDAFVVKYDTAGIPQWARKIGGTLQDDGVSISADSFGNAYLIGRYNSDIVISDV